jgi:hypothetical protein
VRHSAALTEAERRRMGGVRCAVDGRRGPGGGGFWGGIEIGEEQETGDADVWGPGTVPVRFKPIQRFQTNLNQFWICSNLLQVKKDLPYLQNFEIKYGFEGFEEREKLSIGTS